MATKVIIKKSAVAGKTPTSAQLDYGELAINVVDKKIYTKDHIGNVIELSSTSSGGGGGLSGLDGGGWDRVITYDGDDANPDPLTATYDGGGAI
jgi:hypothetical protein